MSSDYQRTGTVLDRILDHKVQEVAAHKAIRSLAEVRQALPGSPPGDLRAALCRETVALIAEVKHASPSRGVLIEPFDPVALGTTYAAHGAAAISVLTDEVFFGGALDHLTAVRRRVKIPVLRKDFIIDPYQVYEARAAGADAVLLIAAALADGPLADLHALAESLGMAALVEVHHEAELERALRLGAPLIGINNRDLKTFAVDLATTERLARQAGAGVTRVAESGIHSRADVERMARASVHAILVGEALVQAADIGVQVRALSGVPRQEAL